MIASAISAGSSLWMIPCAPAAAALRAKWSTLNDDIISIAVEKFSRLIAVHASSPFISDIDISASSTVGG